MLTHGFHVPKHDFHSNSLQQEEKVQMALLCDTQPQLPCPPPLDNTALWHTARTALSSSTDPALWHPAPKALSPPPQWVSVASVNNATMSCTSSSCRHSLILETTPGSKICKWIQMALFPQWWDEPSQNFDNAGEFLLHDFYMKTVGFYLCAQGLNQEVPHAQHVLCQ